MQEWQQDEDQAISQTIVSTTPEVSVVVPSRNEQENIWPPTPRKNFYDKFPSVASGVVVTLAVVWVGYALPGALLVLAAMFIGLAIVFTKKVNREEAITKVL